MAAKEIRRTIRSYREERRIPEITVAAEPEVLKIIGDQAKRNKTAALTLRQIDPFIEAARTEKKKR